MRSVVFVAMLVLPAIAEGASLRAGFIEGARGARMLDLPM
jgi:hypothetical protein